MSGSYFGGTSSGGSGSTELLQFSGKLQYVKQGLNLTSFAVDRAIGHLVGNILMPTVDELIASLPLADAIPPR